MVEDAAVPGRDKIGCGQSQYRPFAGRWLQSRLVTDAIELGVGPDSEPVALAVTAHAEPAAWSGAVTGERTEAKPPLLARETVPEKTACPAGSRLIPLAETPPITRSSMAYQAAIASGVSNRQMNLFMLNPGPSPACGGREIRESLKRLSHQESGLSESSTG